MIKVLARLWPMATNKQKRERESITGSERQQRKRHKELEKCERIDSKRGRELVNREQKRER